MRPLRRILAIVLLGAALAVLFVAPAWAFTVSGGTAEQRADVYATINAAQFPSVEWVESKVGNVDIEILASYPPWWMQTLDSSDDVLVDVFSATAAGVAGRGYIKIHSVYTPGERTFFREIVSHEWSHQVWFALIFTNGATLEWKTRVEAGLSPDPSVWFQNYVESHAEQLRMAAWSNLYWQTPYARTNLNILGNTAVRDFHDRWTGETPPPPPSTTTTTRATTTTLPPTTTTTRYVPPFRTTTTFPPTTSTTGSTTTTTVVRGDPFLDVDKSDIELWNAAWWGRDTGLIWGYVGGTFGPYDQLAHRHAALIADRWIGTTPAGWMDDYSPVTRGDLRDALPGLEWDSERWSETLLRSQLLRLMFRASLQ